MSVSTHNATYASTLTACNSFVAAAAAAACPYVLSCPTSSPLLRACNYVRQILVAITLTTLHHRPRSEPTVDQEWSLSQLLPAVLSSLTSLCRIIVRTCDDCRWAVVGRLPCQATREVMMVAGYVAVANERASEKH